MSEIALIQSVDKLNCIPCTMKKYISFSLSRLKFIDSCQFMQASLDSLAMSTLRNSFTITDNYLYDNHPKLPLELLLQKGVYPYKYMGSWARFDKSELPPKEAFYSKLKEEHITDQDFEHAQAVWNAFGCKTLGAYHDLYLKTDTLLLANVFNFRETCLMH